MGTAAFAKFMKTSDGDSVSKSLCMYAHTYICVYTTIPLALVAKNSSRK